MKTPVKHQTTKDTWSNYSGRTANVRVSFSHSDNAHGFNILPRSLGNHRLQTKPRVSKPNDKYEQEADRVAEQVMRTPSQSVIQNTTTAFVQRKCDACDTEKDELLLRKASQGEGSAEVTVATHQIDGLQNGKPMPRAEQRFFGSRFGNNFDAVRIHDDSQAHYLARNIHAKAFTLGNNIVFGKGFFSPSSYTGRKLLAHELTHVMQQRNQPPLTIQRQEDSTSVVPRLGPLTSPSLAEFLGFQIIDNFTFGLAGLSGTQQAELQQYVTTVTGLLRDHPSGFIEVVGHTDAPGEVADNLQLGQERADAVKAFLVSQGINSDSIFTSSHGEAELRADTVSRNPRNRRVEIRFRASSGFNLGLELGLSPAPDSSADTFSPPELPSLSPFNIPYHMVFPPEPVGPRRAPSIDILRLPPTTRPASPDFLHEASRWLTDSLGRDDIARLGGRLSAELGMDEGEITRQLNDALISAGEAGLKELLRRLIYAIAGSPSRPSALPTGPAVRELEIPGERIFTLPPIPF
jgi:outer membrane protein OmpA-like peptidoglycan-associated protein